MRSLVVLFVVCAAARPGLALPECDDDQTPVAEQALPSDLRAVDVIVPCAFAESGELGPICVDATGYLITSTGVVLCQMTLLEPVLEPSSVEPRATSDGIVVTGSAVSAKLTADSEMALPLAFDRHTVMPDCASSRGIQLCRALIVPG